MNDFSTPVLAFFHDPWVANVAFMYRRFIFRRIDSEQDKEWRRRVLIVETHSAERAY